MITAAINENKCSLTCYECKGQVKPREIYMWFIDSVFCLECTKQIFDRFNREVTDIKRRLQGKLGKITKYEIINDES